MVIDFDAFAWRPGRCPTEIPRQKKVVVESVGHVDAGHAGVRGEYNHFGFPPAILEHVIVCEVIAYVEEVLEVIVGGAAIPSDGATDNGKVVGVSESAEPYAINRAAFAGGP